MIRINLLQGSFGCDRIGFLLCFDNILLVSYPFVTKPIADLNTKICNHCQPEVTVWINLRYCDSTLPCKLLLGLFTWIRIGKVTVKVFIQNFRGFFAKVSSLPPGIQKS